MLTRVTQRAAVTVCLTDATSTKKCSNRQDMEVTVQTVSRTLMVLTVSGVRTSSIDVGRLDHVNTVPVTPSVRAAFVL